MLIYTFIEGEPGEIYISGGLTEFDPLQEYEIIYLYRGGDLTEAYRREITDGYWGISGAGYGNGVYWAAGRGDDGTGIYTSVLRINGDQCDEFAGPGPDDFNPQLVVPISANEAYFFYGNIRYKFINGEWESTELPFVDNYPLFIYDRGNALIYTYDGIYGEGYTCRISDDYFDSYIEEDIIFTGDYPLTDSDVRITGSTFFEGKIYFSAQLLTDTRIWFALIERSGPPGIGEYRVIYRRDKQYGDWSRMLALGYDEVISTVGGTLLVLHYKDGEMTVEDSSPYNVSRMLLNDGVIWAVARKQYGDDDYFNPSELVYHVPGE